MGQNVQLRQIYLISASDIYGKEIKTYFYKFLRGEVKFSNVDELSKRLEIDKENTRKYFSCEII